MERCAGSGCGRAGKDVVGIVAVMAVVIADS